MYRYTLSLSRVFFQFHKRVAFCLDMHNQAVKAMRYAENTKAEWESAEEVNLPRPVMSHVRMWPREHAH
jgi:hypothetical protein